MAAMSVAVAMTLMTTTGSKHKKPACQGKCKLNTKVEIIMKKNKIFAIIAILAITISGVLVFQACKKGETNTTPTTENSKPMPFAVKNLKTGEIVYNVTAEKLQSEMENRNLFKGDDRYIIESLQITNVSSKRDEKEFIKCSIIDTETEITTTHFLNSEFIDKETTENIVNYYIDDEIMSGNFSMAIMGPKTTVITVENFIIVNSEILPDSLLMYKPKHNDVICHAHNCIAGDCQPLYDINDNGVGCTPCHTAANPQAGAAFCDWDIEPGGGGGGNGGMIIGVIGVLVSMIGWFL